MDDGASLERLVTLAGVAPDYWDIWGNHHYVDAEAKRSILGALGLSAADGADIAASIRALEEQGWRRRLPPVLVAREGDRPEIPLSLPADRANSAFRLTILRGNRSRKRVRLPARGCGCAGSPVGGRPGGPAVPRTPAAHIAHGIPRRSTGGPAGRDDAAHHRPSQVLPSAVARGRRHDLGDLRSALHTQPPRELGDRRLYRPSRTGRRRRRCRSLRDRAQPPARAVPCPPRGGEPLLAQHAAVSQSALYRCRSGPGVCRVHRGARRQRCRRHRTCRLPRAEGDRLSPGQADQADDSGSALCLLSPQTRRRGGRRWTGRGVRALPPRTG